MILPTANLLTSVLFSISLTEYPCLSKEMTEAQVAAEVALVVEVKFQHAKVMQIISHVIFYYYYHSHLKQFLLKNWKKLETIDAHKTVPMSCNFVLLITS